MAHPYRRKRGGHPLRKTSPLGRAVVPGVFLVAAACACSAALPVVDSFAGLWVRIDKSPSQAAKGLAAFGASHPPYVDLVLWGRAKALQKSEPQLLEGILDSLEQMDSSPASLLAREWIVDLRFPASRKPDSTEAADLEKYLSKKLRPDTRLALRKRLFQAWLDAGRNARAESLFVEQLRENPPLAQIRATLTRLALDTGFLRSPGLRRPLVSALLSAGQADSALSILDTLLVKATLTPFDHILRGRILLEQGKADEAISSFRKAAEDATEEQGLMWLAKGLEKVGRTADAQIAFAEYARRWPRSPQAQSILWTSGFEAERAGNCREASELYGKVKVGGGRRAEWARFRDGFCWYRQGQWAKAEQILSREKEAASGTQREAAWFFHAKALAAQGKDSLARAEFAALAAWAPWGFHGHIARRVLGRDSLFADSLRKEPDTGFGLWLGERTIALETSDTVAFARLLMARAIGDNHLVRETDKSLDEVLKGKGEREFALIRWMKTLGMEKEVTPRMRRLLGKLPNAEIARLSKSVMREFYPMPYKKEALGFLKGDSVIDAALVHAIMRQESAYDRFARSGAGAVGLLQLIPPTAKAMARKAGLSGFQVEQLTDAEVNLRLGITYLRDLNRVWKGHIPLVLANYNAGPVPVMRWRAAFDSLAVESAAEEITYWETRDYVKKCMGGYWTYRMLYPDAK